MTHQPYMHKPDELLQVSGAETPRTVSFKPEVSTDDSGKFYGNSLAFATREEAEASARDLAGRWMLVREWRVVESDQPVNYAIVDGKLVEA